MVNYPFLQKGALIGVTAPSSGISTKLHDLLKQTCDRMEEKGYLVDCGETVWT
ncbi:peptidase S66 [Jeotgalibacillus soli]|uniref:Peptidase S66 n=1 Tax=Jeotgalibacillus soli TaxID=889306 RepID=A0A0C2VKV6_9BACL|nr:peptidase S66 [Jeotgalibacillus soli]